jgi:alkylation response protein AidB-like acyl-CoA dehydrogenase
MDTLLNDDEAMIKETAATFLSAQSPTSLVRSAEASANKYSPELWASIAELGWCGLCLPEACGGQAAPVTWLGLLLEEVGRHVAPIPLAVSSAAALTIARFGSSAQQDMLAKVTSGELILTYAIQERDGAWNLDAISTTGRMEGEEVVLDGMKSFVDSVSAAGKLLVAFRNKQDGALGLALVDSASPGLQVHKLVNTAKSDQAAVVLDGVRVPSERLVGGWDKGEAAARYLMQLAAMFTASQMAGAARRATEMAVEYSKIRFAFGQPIGSFQSLQHMAADMIIAVDGTELLAREALWRIEKGLPAELEVSQAKAFGNQHCVATCRSAQQIHGGMGFMMEFDLHLWYRRVVTWSLSAGTTYEHRRIVSGLLLDKPGHMRLDDCHPVKAPDSQAPVA